MTAARRRTVTSPGSVPQRMPGTCGRAREEDEGSASGTGLAPQAHMTSSANQPLPTDPPPPPYADPPVPTQVPPMAPPRDPVEVPIQDPPLPPTEDPPAPIQDPPAPAGEPSPGTSFATVPPRTSDGPCGFGGPRSFGPAAAGLPRAVPGRRNAPLPGSPPRSSGAKARVARRPEHDDPDRRGRSGGCAAAQSDDGPSRLGEARRAAARKASASTRRLQVHRSAHARRHSAPTSSTVQDRDGEPG